MHAERSLRSLFEPSVVAVVGASAREGSPGRVVWSNLRRFRGAVVPVNPGMSSLDAVPAYPSLVSVPDRIDLAVVATPAATLPAIITDAVAARVRSCVVLSAGFAETGDRGRALQQRVVELARAGGVVLAGPNCLGVQNWGLSLNASLAVGTARPGGLAVLTQSGSWAMAPTVLSAEERAGFSIVCSTGNRADIDDAEVLDFLCDHEPTTVVAMLTESVIDGPRLLDAAARLSRAGKPLVIAAPGRTEDGARSAATHTGALARDRRAWNDLLAESGVTVVRTGQEMLDVARALHDQPPARGHRVGIITNSGGAGTELSDLLCDEGLAVPLLSAPLRGELEAILPSYASTANPIDLTPDWRRFPDLYSAALRLLATSGEVDVVIAVLLHRSAARPVSEAIARELRQLRAEACTVPVVSCWVAPRAAWPEADPLRDAGVPTIDGPTRTARVVGQMTRHTSAPKPLPSLIPGVPLTPLPAADAPDLVADFLVRHRIPFAPTVVVDDVDAAVTAAGQAGYPVVAKVAHPELSHKSDVGGVRTGLADQDAVRGAVVELLQLRKGARVTIQHQYQGLELMAGGYRDPTFGPVVVFGAGGELVELLGSVAFARAPLSRQGAERLLARAPCRSLLEGFRGRPSVDKEALIRLLVAVGEVMAIHPTLLALDLNPILATKEACIAVDARLVPIG